MTCSQRRLIAGTRPLANIKVLDFSFMMAGPYCTRILADLGATVIKVETPTGDYVRSRPPLRDGWSSYYGHLNVGKQSIILDLKKTQAVEIAKRLAAACDIVVENFRPGVMKRLGIDFDVLSAINPELIYCAISGFGQSGPAANRPAYAPIVHAASGYDMANLSYQDDTQRPTKTAIFIADIMAGIQATVAIEAALLARERTRSGQFIDVTLVESMFNLQVYEFQEAQCPTDARRPLYQPLRTSDGYVIVAPVTQNNFVQMAACIGHPEWCVDPRFTTATSRGRNWDLLMSLVETWTRQRSGNECEHLLTAAGVPCSRYLTIGEAMQDPHYDHRGSFAMIEDPAGSYKIPKLPFQMSAVDIAPRSYVADHGADTEMVLKSLLDLSDDEIAALTDSGVFGS
ncbi:MAG: CoA transferase [Proteobacteria bacterium]|nr:MAG: CoA transferase [Pseudomonadota bacterium]QKK12326.1 MAG: CoA transferase [Pseudomonadota bacterium]